MCQDDDVIHHNGAGGKFVYGEKFDDGHFILKHTGPFIFSQFFICVAKIEWWGGKHVVFGKVKDGMNIMEAMECFGSSNGKTSKKITIADCGQI
ncbi:unnamed protein product [Nyctereutes procyonoides]|uniref:Peptidyl-prolyl cis-trans isomerase n=1 Tax=Nyctereutes procyonoides TaxID=34880 RepID=A0A811ZHZ4_NYCPR|nr:unnamed protein product [Nyctereutes procyonoides]CAD7688124.1 unnamed protein product [Nyctereutes procyonoides]